MKSEKFLYKAQKKAFKNTDEKIVKIKRELAGIQNSINACMSALLNASETSETITNSIIEFEKRQKVLKEQLAIIEKEKDMQYEEFSKEQIEQYLSAVSNIKTKSLQSKRNIILLLISKITVDSWKEEAIDPRNKSSKPYFSIKIEGMLGKMCVEKIASWDYQHTKMTAMNRGHSFIFSTIMEFVYTPIN